MSRPSASNQSMRHIATDESKSTSIPATVASSSAAAAASAATAEPEEESESSGACAQCGELSELCCAKCKRTYYCSRECQKSDSDDHKKECAEGHAKAMAKERAERVANIHAAMDAAFGSMAAPAGLQSGVHAGSPYDVEFIDAQEMHRLHPSTFEAPTRVELRRIRVGMMVKVSCNNERFWVQVTSVRGKQVSGTIANVLICEQPFDNGDLIHFQKKNIFAIQEQE